MDEITLFKTLQPPPPADAGRIREAARARLDSTLAGALGNSPGPARPQFRGAPRRRRRLALAAGAVAVAAAVAIAVPVLLPAHDAGPFVTAAWAVQPNPDGTFKVTFKELHDPAGLQRALRADGVAAYVRYIPWKRGRIDGTIATWPAFACSPDGGPTEPGRVADAVFPSGPFPRQDGSDTWIVIRPSAMPNGTAIFITMEGLPTQPGFVVGFSVMGNDRPPCASL